MIEAKITLRNGARIIDKTWPADKHADHCDRYIFVTAEPRTPNRSDEVLGNVVVPLPVMASRKCQHRSSMSAIGARPEDICVRRETGKE